MPLGTCGAPIGLDEGWLLLTHDVGPMRHRAIGATRLAKDGPPRVLARSCAPLLRPAPGAHERYVPNVVYTCGALRCGPLLVVPFARCGSFTTVSTLRISEALAGLEWPCARGGG